MKLHRLSLALIAVVAAVAPLASAAPSAAADDIVFTCFPHAPAELRYDNSWGAARSGGRGHKGTDLMSPKGTHVLAVADGEVVGLESGGLSGYYVRIAHDDGWETYSMHLDNDTPGTDDGRGGPDTAFAPGLAVGDRVHAGQHIGYVGDSGNAEGSSPHTHFELHIGGSAVNPYQYLVDAEARNQGLGARIAAATLPEERRGALRPDLWDSPSTGTAPCVPVEAPDPVEYLSPDHLDRGLPDRGHLDR